MHGVVWLGEDEKTDTRRGQMHMVANEVRVTIVDHLINHSLTMAEPGQVQPNVGQSMVSLII